MIHIALHWLLLGVALSGLDTARLAGESQRLLACVGAPLPEGWIVVDRLWRATACGRGSPSAPNVLVIERFDNRVRGSSMTVCASAPTPRGWAQRSTHWRAVNRCLARSSPSVPNVKLIVRVQ